MLDLATLISNVCDLMETEKEYWYRGHSKKSYKLIPTVFRPLNKEGTQFYDESKLLAEFVRRHPEAMRDHSSTIELLTYAQHYGLPTRLLDWTQNLLVAIFFCCKEHQSEDGYLYILQPPYYEKKTLSFHESLVNSISPEDVLELILNESEFDTLDKVIKKLNINGVPYADFKDMSDTELSHWAFAQKSFLIQSCEKDITHWWVRSSLCAYKPFLINERLVAQKGCFTSHSGKYIKGVSTLNAIDIENEPGESPIVSKIEIRASSKVNILKQLEICGIDEATLFPELEYQTRSIKEQCVDYL
ncbi:MAG: FRG domain-containing protein [Saprospiraceae bacterium]|nr:FRG domain-containing protein [Saprospiraceae bacterium]